MQTLKQLFNLTQVSQKVHCHLAESACAQTLWQAVAPSHLLAYSHATRLTSGHILNVVASNGAVANKIKLLSASLLTKLQNLANTPEFQHASKVTVIKIKVQVNSSPVLHKRRPRRLTLNAANHLSNLIDELEESDLKDSLNKLISRYEHE